MNKILSLVLISMLMEFSSVDANTYKMPLQPTEDTALLNFYRGFSEFTDPGDYAYLYENLPDSLSELCSLIRNQFLHPYAELPKYRELIPQERWNETMKYSTVRSILEGLLSYDSSGLVSYRKPEDRLVLGCRNYSILLASILKHRGIPTRLRYGHATYIIPEFHASHVVCEVWNGNDKRWMLVDPNTGMIDFSREKFDISNEAWLKMQKKEIDPSLYGLPNKYTGLVSIVGKVCSDLASILGNEHTVYQYAPILNYIFKNNNELAPKHIKTLNRVSELMQSVSAENISELRNIYNNTPEIQITESFSFGPTKQPNCKAKTKGN